MLRLPRLFRRKPAKPADAAPTSVSEAAAILAKAAKNKARQPIRDRANQMRADQGKPPIDWSKL